MDIPEIYGPYGPYMDFLPEIYGLTVHIWIFFRNGLTDGPYMDFLPEMD